MFYAKYIVLFCFFFFNWQTNHLFHCEIACVTFVGKRGIKTIQALFTVLLIAETGSNDNVGNMLMNPAVKLITSIVLGETL